MAQPSQQYQHEKDSTNFLRELILAEATISQLFSYHLLAIF